MQSINQVIYQSTQSTHGCVSQSSQATNQPTKQWMNNDKLKQLEQLVYSTNQSNIQLIRNQSVNRLLDYQSVINFISLSIMVMVKSRQYGVWSHGTDTAALRLYESTLSKLWVDYSKGIVMADIETLTHDTDRIYLYGTVTGDASARNVQARTFDWFSFDVHHHHDIILLFHSKYKTLSRIWESILQVLLCF